MPPTTPKLALLLLLLPIVAYDAGFPLPSALSPSAFLGYDPISTIAQSVTDPAFAFPSVVSAFLPLPFVTSGYCTEGKTYTIRSIRDLQDNLGDLECIFAAGQSPTAVGLGYNYGTLLTAANTGWAGIFAAPVYQGDYVIRTRCRGRPLNIGTLHVAGLSLGTAEWYLGRLNQPVAAGEFYDPSIDSLIMDFTVDVNELCPLDDPDYLLNNKGFLPFKNSIPPINSYIDIGRVVGRDAEDGGIIFLNKAMASDPESGLATVLYYTVKNFDPAVNPDWPREGRPVVVPRDFTYSREGLRAPLERLGTVVNITREHLESSLRSSHLPFLGPLNALVPESLSNLAGPGMIPFLGPLTAPLTALIPESFTNMAGPGLPILGPLSALIPESVTNLAGSGGGSLPLNLLSPLTTLFGTITSPFSAILSESVSALEHLGMTTSSFFAVPPTDSAEKPSLRPEFDLAGSAEGALKSLQTLLSPDSARLEGTQKDTKNTQETSTVASPQSAAGGSLPEERKKGQREEAVVEGNTMNDNPLLHLWDQYNANLINLINKNNQKLLSKVEEEAKSDADSEVNSVTPEVSAVSEAEVQVEEATSQVPSIADTQNKAALQRRLEEANESPEGDEHNTFNAEEGGHDQRGIEAKDEADFSSRMAERQEEEEIERNVREAERVKREETARGVDALFNLLLLSGPEETKVPEAAPAQPLMNLDPASILSFPKSLVSPLVAGASAVPGLGMLTESLESILSSAPGSGQGFAQNGGLLPDFRELTRLIWGEDSLTQNLGQGLQQTTQGLQQSLTQGLQPLTQGLQPLTQGFSLLLPGGSQNGENKRATLNGESDQGLPAALLGSLLQLRGNIGLGGEIMGDFENAGPSEMLNQLLEMGPAAFGPVIQNFINFFGQLGKELAQTAMGAAGNIAGTQEQQ